MTSIASTLDALAPTTFIAPDRRFLGALDRMAAIMGAPVDTVEVRPSADGSLVTVGAGEPRTLSALPTAAELWAVVDAQARALGPDTLWPDAEAKPLSASFAAVGDVERAMATLATVEAAAAKGQRSREDLRRWCAGVIVLLVATAGDGPGADALASEAIAATALAQALGMDMSVERVLIEHVLGYTVEATAHAPNAPSVPPAIRSAIEQPGRLRDAATWRAARTAFEWELLLRTIPRDSADAELAKQVGGALARAPNAPGLGAFALALQWSPADAPKQARRVLRVCAPGRTVPPALAINEFGPPQANALLASVGTASGESFVVAPLRVHTCRALTHALVETVVRYWSETQGSQRAVDWAGALAGGDPIDEDFIAGLQFRADARTHRSPIGDLSRAALAVPGLSFDVVSALLTQAADTNRFSEHTQALLERALTTADSRPSERRRLGEHVGLLRGDRQYGDAAIASSISTSAAGTPRAWTEALRLAGDAQALLAIARDEGLPPFSRNLALDALARTPGSAQIEGVPEAIDALVASAAIRAPRDAAARARAVSRVVERQGCDAAIPVAERALAAPLDDTGLKRAAITTELARCLLSVGRYEDGAKVAARAAASGTEASLITLARAHAHLGRLEEADKLLDEAAARYPGQRYEVEHAAVAWIAGDFSHAADVVTRRAARGFPAGSLARALDAHFPVAAGDEPMFVALDPIVSALSEPPDVVELGRALHKHRRYDAAIHVFLATRPTSAQMQAQYVAGAYKAARAKGLDRAQALEVVRAHFPPGPAGISALLYQVESAWELTWDALPDPATDPAAGGLAWLSRASVEAERGFPDPNARAAIEAHYAPLGETPDDRFSALALHLLGKVDAEVAWSFVSTHSEATTALFHLGCGAWGRGDVHHAMRLWRAAEALRQLRDLEYTGAAIQLWTKGAHIAPLEQVHAHDLEKIHGAPAVGDPAPSDTD